MSSPQQAKGQVGGNHHFSRSDPILKGLSQFYFLCLGVCCFTVDFLPAINIGDCLIIRSCHLAGYMPNERKLLNMGHSLKFGSASNKMMHKYSLHIVD
jgi:hypothetical protein